MLRHERWPSHDAPHSVWYFADVLPTPAGGPDLHNPLYPAQRQAAAMDQARQFVSSELPRMLPKGAIVNTDQFDETKLVPRDRASTTEPGSRLAQQYIRANVQPTERCVQAVAGSTRHRLDAGKAAGIGNLYLAGDWTYNGLNVGCVESALMSDKLAGNAVLGLVDPSADVHGYFER